MGGFVLAMKTQEVLYDLPISILPKPLRFHLSKILQIVIVLFKLSLQMGSNVSDFAFRNFYVVIFLSKRKRNPIIGNDDGDSIKEYRFENSMRVTSDTARAKHEATVENIFNVGLVFTFCVVVPTLHFADFAAGVRARFVNRKQLSAKRV